MSSIPGIEPIIFRGYDLKLLFSWMFVYAVILFLSPTVFAKNKHEKIREAGGSYLASFINASICFYYGSKVTYAIWNAPEEVKSLVIFDSSAPWYQETQTAWFTAHPFIAFLAVDMLHMILHFPKLGGFDQIFHHFMFLSMSSSVTLWGIMPFAGMWLMCGELSTLFLDIRWYLITTGQGASKMMDVTNMLFAVTFFLTRVVLYWVCLWNYHTQTTKTLLRLGATKEFLVWPMSVLITVGAFLNLYWFSFILKIALGKGKTHDSPKKEKKEKKEKKAA